MSSIDRTHQSASPASTIVATAAMAISSHGIGSPATTAREALNACVVGRILAIG